MSDFGVSPLTHTIFMGKSKPCNDGTGHRQWVGEKKDVTTAVLKAAFECMYLRAEETGSCHISIPGLGVLSFTRDEDARD